MSHTQRELDAATLEGVATRYFVLEQQRNRQLLQAAQREIDSNRAEIHRLRQQMTNLQREREAHASRVASLEASLSWSVTAPLRRLAAVFSPARRA